MPRPGQMLLSKAVEEYLDLRRGRYSEATVYNDTYVLRRFVREMGDIQVMNVRPEKVDRWFATLLRPNRTSDGLDRKGVAPISYNNTRARVLQFSRYCQARGFTRADWLVHTPRLKQPRRQHQQIGVDVLWQMLESATDPRDRALLAFSMNTACRSAEVKPLRVEDVDLANREVRLWVQKSQVADALPLTPELAAELTQWLRVCSADLLKHEGRTLRGEDYLFPAKRPSHPRPAPRGRALPGRDDLGGLRPHQAHPQAPRGGPAGPECRGVAVQGRGRPLDQESRRPAALRHPDRGPELRVRAALDRCGDSRVRVRNPLLG